MHDLKIFSKNWDYFTILLDHSQDVFWITNNDYTVQIYVSPAFEKIWGYDSEVLYKKPLFWLQTIVEDDKMQLASVSRLPHSCTQSYYQEKYRIKRADGEIRWIEDHTYPVINHIGQCIGYAGIAKDITYYLRLEQELQAANQFLPKLAEKMERSVFWVLDASLKKQLYVSKGFEKIWGRPVEFMYENPENWAETLVPEDQRKEVGSKLFQSEEEGVPPYSDTSYRIRRPDGQIRWIRDTSFPIYDDSTGACIGFAGIAEDVTEAKLYEIELRQAKEKAEAANIAKSNFIASMSHDFRTPLNGLLGMAEMLRSGRCYPEQKEYVDAILQAGNSLLDLVEDIINFIALDLDKLPVSEEWFNLEKVIDEIMLTLSPQAHEKKVEMILNFSESAPKEVYGDVNRVRRILMNLINNAVKFTNKGHVLINIELDRITKSKTWLQFMVEDTGIGISPEKFEYIFGSFNRIDPSYRGRYKGVGLGLTIVKQFIQDLGGKIKVNSKLNQGSVFYCTVPFKRLEQTKTVKFSDHYSHLKTIIVDDFKKRAITFIKQFGFTNADTANSKNIFELLGEANRGSQPYQLVIVDDEVNCDIVAIAKKVRAQGKGCLILIADKESAKLTHKLKKLGFKEYITKPLQPLVIVKSLENVAVSLTAKGDDQNLKKEHKVLLVEDDLLTQKITSWMLEEFNCKVDIAATGGQALGFLKNSYDLILLDVGLPDVDGIEFAKKIRETQANHAKTPIVALTAHVLERDKEKCLEAGMNDFLKKPLFKKDLKKLIMRIFN